VSESEIAPPTSDGQQQYIDLLVRTTYDGAALDALIASLPVCVAALLHDSATNERYMQRDGCFVVRVFEDAEFFKYAIEQQGYGQVILSDHLVEPTPTTETEQEQQVHWVPLAGGSANTVAITLDAHSLSQALTSLLGQERATGHPHLLQIMIQAVPDGASVEFTRFAVTVVARGEDVVSSMQAAPDAQEHEDLPPAEQKEEEHGQ